MEMVPTNASFAFRGTGPGERGLRIMDTHGNMMARSKAILDRAKREGRELTPEEVARFDTLMAMMQLNREEETERTAPGYRAPFKPDPNDGLAGFGGFGVGIPVDELRKFSLGRAIQAAVLGDWRVAGHEREVSDYISERSGRPNRGGNAGFYWPLASEKRDITIATEGTDIMQVTHREPIDLLRNKTAVLAAGATAVRGLAGSGEVQFPRLTASGSGGWVAEGVAPAESTQTFGQMRLTPKTLIAYTDITRQTILQTSFAIQDFIERDLISVLGIELDRAALHGSGASNQPTGLAGQTGVNIVAIGTNGGPPLWAHIVDMENQAALDNADLTIGSFITNPKVRAKLRQTLKLAAGTSPAWVFDDTQPRRELLGYPTMISNQVASNLVKGTSGAVCSAVFFGDWSELVLGFWSDIDVLIDPFTGSKEGIVRVVCYLTADIGVRHGESFSAILDATTT